MKIYKLENPYVSANYTSVIYDTYEAAKENALQIYDEFNLKCEIKEILIPSIEIEGD